MAASATPRRPLLLLGSLSGRARRLLVGSGSFGLLTGVALAFGPVPSAVAQCDSGKEGSEEGPDKSMLQQIMDTASGMLGPVVGTLWPTETMRPLEEWLEDQFSALYAPSKRKMLPATPKIVPVPVLGNVGLPVKTIVLDLEDTLIHQTFTFKHGNRTAKRPGVDDFLKFLHLQGWEVVLFTDTPSGFAMDVAEKLDKNNVIVHKLYRDGCRTEGSVWTLFAGGARHVKDLSYINRDLKRVIMIDDEPDMTDNKENLLTIKPWKGDPNDTELTDLKPFLYSIMQDDFQAAKEHRPAPDLQKKLARYSGQEGVRLADAFRAEQAARKARTASVLGKGKKMPAKAKKEATAAAASTQYEKTQEIPPAKRNRTSWKAWFTGGNDAQ